MVDNNSRLEFIRGDNNTRSGFSWERTSFSPIKVGAEGDKGILALQLLGKRTAEGLFEKDVVSLDEAKREQSIIHSLRDRQIPTFKLFKVAEKKDGDEIKYVTITEDRSRGGKRWVVSSNNREIINNPNYYQTIRRISPDVRNILVNQIFSMAINAGKADSEGNSLSFEEPDMRMNPFMLDIDPANPDSEADIIVGDLGIDVKQIKDDPDQVIRRNIRAANQFLVEMLGYFDGIPKDHPAYKYRDVYSDSEWKQIKDQEKWFEMMLR